jgi:cyclic pyranopterin phosphate synthase
LLNFDELEQVASTFVDLGVRKLRLTGGEPLLRRDLPKLVQRLSRLNLRELCLTTNGSLLEGQAQALADAGLNRVTVSLDAIDESTFRRITDGQTPLSRVLRGIDAARRFGLGPVKINMVVQRGTNDGSILEMAAWARCEQLELRMIEYMDVGCSNGWRLVDVVTAAELRRRIDRVWPIDPVVSADGSETAERFRYRDGSGYLGIIAAISRPFCGGCTRARVSSVGALYSCLFAPTGVELATPLRAGYDLRPIIAGLWQRRVDRYSELRAEMPVGRSRPEMSAIGG